MRFLAIWRFDCRICFCGAHAHMNFAGALALVENGFRSRYWINMLLALVVAAFTQASGADAGEGVPDVNNRRCPTEQTARGPVIVCSEHRGTRHLIPLTEQPDRFLMSQRLQTVAIQEIRCTGIMESQAKAIFRRRYGKRLERMGRIVAARNLPVQVDSDLADERASHWRTCDSAKGAERRFVKALETLEKRYGLSAGGISN